MARRPSLTLPFLFCGNLAKRSLFRCAAACQDSSVYRDLRRERPFGHLRVWTPPDTPNGSSPAPIAIEFGGLINDPSSYGLLGGALVDGDTRFEVSTHGANYGGSLARGQDVVSFGLPDEYRDGVLSAVPSGLAVMLAAHGKASSSPFIFGILARVLVTFLQEGVPPTDSATWAVFLEAGAVSWSRIRPGTLVDND
jgi:hypothetical protein